MRAPQGFTALALLALTALPGCFTTVGSPAAASATNTDEVWYVKQTYVLFFRVRHDVYYCPPSEGVAPKVCSKAVLHDGAE